MGGQFFMAKYSYEFKKQVIQSYLNGEGGYAYLAKGPKEDIILLKKKIVLRYFNEGFR